MLFLMCWSCAVVQLRSILHDEQQIIGRGWDTLYIPRVSWACMLQFWPAQSV
jgi:hypothetical protein